MASSAVLLALGFMLALPANATSQAPRRSDVGVVGAGTLAWEQVVVRSRPSPSSSRVGILRQFRPDFRPQYVLALSAQRSKSGEPSWFRVSVPGRPNGRTGWVRAASVELRPVHKRLVIYRGARRFEYWDGEQAHSHGEDRRRSAWRRDASRPLLRDRQVQSADRPGLVRARVVCIRDERLLEDHRLARRRHSRRARDILAVAAGTGRLARLCAAAQQRHQLPPLARSSGYADQDRPLATTTRRRTRTEQAPRR